MKKALKVTGKILLGIVAVIAVVLAGTSTYNIICSASEKDLLENQLYGRKVEVYGHKMSIYVAGCGRVDRICDGLCIRSYGCNNRSA